MNTKSRQTIRRGLLAALLLVLLAACAPVALAPSATDSPTSAPSATPVPSATPMPEQPSLRPGKTPQLETVEPSPTPGVIEMPGRLMDILQADLVERFGSLPENLTVVSAEAVVWNDGSLGCPKPGVFYIQSMVDGYHVVLRSGETTYDYHIGSLDTQPVLCEADFQQR